MATNRILLLNGRETPKDSVESSDTPKTEPHGFDLEGIAIPLKYIPGFGFEKEEK